MYLSMLNPRIKSLCLMFSLIGHEQGVINVEGHERRSLFLMFQKCDHHLHPLAKSKSDFVDWGKNDWDYNLDIFEMIANTIEPSKEFVSKKLLIFKLYQMDVHFEGY